MNLSRTVHFLLLLCAASGSVRAQDVPADPVAESKTPQQDHRTKRDEIAAAATEALIFGQYERAASLGEQMLAIERNWLGENHFKIGKSLDWLASAYVQDENWDAALARRRDLVEFEIRRFGPDHWKVTEARMGVKHVEWQKIHTPAERFQLSRMNEVNNQFLQQYSEGKHKEALVTGRRVLTTYENLVGRDNPLYARTLGNLGALYGELSEFDLAEDHYQQAIEIEQDLFGRMHPRSANTLNNYGYLLLQKGDLAQAETFYLDALRIKKELFGETSAEYAATLGNLAFLYRLMKRYSDAEPLTLKTMVILKATLGESHQHYATSLNNTAMLYREIGDYRKALTLYIQARDVTKNAVGEEHPLYATSLHNLAFMHSLLGNTSEARSMYREALAIQEDTTGIEHPDYILTLHNLAYLDHQMGNLEQAKMQYLESLRLRRRILGESHPDVARSLHNLAGLYVSMGSPNDAELLYRQAVAIRTHVHGTDHPDVSSSLSGLAFAQKTQRKYSEAASHFLTSLQSARRHVDLTASIQSEAEQLLYADLHRSRLDNYLTTFSRLSKPADEAFRATWEWKGSTFLRQRAIRVLSDDSELDPIFRRLREVTQQLGFRKDARPKIFATPTGQDILDEKRQLEAKLSRRSDAYRMAETPPTPDDLLSVLPKDSALVDYLVCNDFYQDASQIQARHSPILFAFVVRPDRNIELLKLGRMESIGKDISLWRESFGGSDAGAAAGQRLRQAIWDPVEKLLGGASTVLVSPDGMLCQLPLAALPGKQSGTFLIEEHRLAYIPAPRLIPKLLTGSAARTDHSILLIGDIDYGKSANGADTWIHLPGSASELNQLARLYEKHSPTSTVTLITGDTAKKSTLQTQLPAHSVIHIATHGYFSSRDIPLGAGSTRVADPGERHTAQVVDSGLVLSGANVQSVNRKSSTRGESGAAGFLMDSDILALPLRNADLVVLSACDTGQGATAQGEGVLGTQRAFHVAGARSTLASLWKVDDLATQVLMVRFHENLISGNMSRLDAIRQAQLDILRNGRDLLSAASADNQSRGAQILRQHLGDLNTGRLPPYYWAAFQLSGDWR